MYRLAEENPYVFLEGFEEWCEEDSKNAAMQRKIRAVVEKMIENVRGVGSAKDVGEGRAKLGLKTTYMTILRGGG